MAYKDKIKQRQFDRIWKRKQRYNNRIKAIKILGGKCLDCGIDDVRVLQFDHKELVRRKGEERMKSRGSDVTVNKIIKNELTNKDIAVRCANCHMIKTGKDKEKFGSFKGL